MEKTYLTTVQLAKRLHYHPRYIREKMMDRLLIDGTHYFRPFGGRKILFIWETIEQDMVKLPPKEKIEIPMMGGGVCYG